MRFRPRKPKTIAIKNDRYVINERILAPQMRVIDNKGEQIGVLSRQEALDMAREQHQDLILIAEGANPPVVKLIELSKHKYREQQKRQEDAKSAKVSEVKEIRLSPFIAAGDLESRIAKTREFLEDGDKVRVVMRFKGRQVTKADDFGKRVFDHVFTAVSDLGRIEIEPKLQGKFMSGQVTPLGKNKKAALAQSVVVQ